MKAIKRLIGLLSFLFIMGTVGCVSLFILMPFIGIDRANQIIERAIDNKVCKWMLM